MNNTRLIMTNNFWGKQKPLKHYFEHGLIKFRVSGNDLFYELIQITKIGRFVLSSGKVKDKQHLDSILKSDTFEQLAHLV